MNKSSLFPELKKTCKAQKKKKKKRVLWVKNYEFSLGHDLEVSVISGQKQFE